MNHQCVNSIVSLTAYFDLSSLLKQYDEIFRPCYPTLLSSTKTLYLVGELALIDRVYGELYSNSELSRTPRAE